MTAELKRCIEQWESLPVEEVAEDVALAFIYLAMKLDRHERGPVWERLLHRVEKWNARLINNSSAPKFQKLPPNVEPNKK